MKLLLSFLLLPLTIVLGGKPIRNISITLRGKKFDVEEATTVSDVLGEIKAASGVDGRLLISGQQFKATDNLEDLGVKDGAALQMVPKIVSSKKKKTAMSATKKVESDSLTKEKAPSSSSSTAGGGMSDISELLKSAAGGTMPGMDESMDSMQQMMNSPIFQEYMNDPEKLEGARQMIINNPMMYNMMLNLPGMKEILEDPVAWREAMKAAATMYKDMDPEMIKSMMGSMGGGPGGDPGGLGDSIKSMMGNMGGGPGGLGDLSGLFGGGDTTNTNNVVPSALDELSEDDE